VLEAAQPGDRSIADDLIERFDLEGEAAETVHEAFDVTTTGEDATTAFGSVVLLVSALSFTRRLQRLYEESWGLPTRGMKGTGWGVAWLALMALWITLHPALDSYVRARSGLFASLLGLLVVGLGTPYVLLGRRLPLRTLLLQAGLTAAGLLALGVWTAIYMPRAIASSAADYGVIGVAFALLTWLWGVGIVLVCAAVYGALWHPRRRAPAPDAIDPDPRRA
jgi:membrane protein